MIVVIALTASALGGRLGVNPKPHGALPGAYVAVPGPWRWRWVRVLHPPPGSPHFVRQRYRRIKYVSATPIPTP